MIILLVVILMHLSVIEYIFLSNQGLTNFHFSVMVVRGLNTLTVLAFIFSHLNILTLGQLLMMRFLTKPVKDLVLYDASLIR